MGNVTGKVTLELSVHHWRFEDGKPEWVGISKVYPEGYRDPVPQGWYCWVYPTDDRAYEKWMKKHCPTADITHRFNSGDPMYTTYIKDEKEVLMFMLKWKVK